MTSLIKASEAMKPEEEKEILARAKSGDKAAINKVITSCIRLIRKKAQKWCDSTDVSVMDLEQAGLIGLLRSIEMYDETYNNKFLTYAQYWISQSIYREATKEIFSGVGGTGGMYGGKYRKIRKALIKHNDDVDMASKETGVMKSTAEGVLMLSKHIRSLDVGKEEESSLEYFSHDGMSPIDYVHSINMSNTLRRAINSLPQRLRDVIRWRFEYDMTLESIATGWGITRERVRQIEAVALSTLKKRIGHLEEACEL